MCCPAVVAEGLTSALLVALHNGKWPSRQLARHRKMAVAGRRWRGYVNCTPHVVALACRCGQMGEQFVESRRTIASAAADIEHDMEPRHTMDFLKPRYTPMSRRRRIYEGKAKVLYEGPEPGTLIQHFKDDATAFNAKKHQVIEGKGVLNNRTSEYLFQNLNDMRVRTHLIRRIKLPEQMGP